MYALAGITIKMYAFRKLSDFWFLPMIVFLGNYYMLQDMTQIRASVVTGILLLSIIPLSQGKRSKVFLMIFGCCLIHYSSLALLPMLFLNNKDLSVNKRWLWAMIVPFGYALSLAKINILTELPIPYISSKIELYQELSEQGVKGDEINVFNAVVLVKMFTYLYVLYFYETIRYYNKYLPILVKMMGFSTLSYLTLSFLPTLAIRVSELYGIVDILMYTSIFYTIKPGWFGKLVVCTIGLVMFCINIFYIEIFNA